MTFKRLEKNTYAILEALQQGPVVVAHFASESFKFYESGIFDGEGCERFKEVNHTAVIVGYNLIHE